MANKNKVDERIFIVIPVSIFLIFISLFSYFVFYVPNKNEKLFVKTVSERLCPDSKETGLTPLSEFYCVGKDDEIKLFYFLSAWRVRYLPTDHVIPFALCKASGSDYSIIINDRYICRDGYKFEGHTDPIIKEYGTTSKYLINKS